MLRTSISTWLALSIALATPGVDTPTSASTPAWDLHGLPLGVVLAGDQDASEIEPRPSDLHWCWAGVPAQAPRLATIPQRAAAWSRTLRSHRHTSCAPRGPPAG